MAKFISTTKTNRANENQETVIVNLDNVTYATKIASDAVEVKFLDGSTIIVKTPIEDLI